MQTSDQFGGIIIIIVSKCDRIIEIERERDSGSNVSSMNRCVFNLVILSSIHFLSSRKQSEMFNAGIQQL